MKLFLSTEITSCAGGGCGTIWTDIPQEYQSQAVFLKRISSKVITSGEFQDGRSWSRLEEINLYALPDEGEAVVVEKDDIIEFSNLLDRAYTGKYTIKIEEFTINVYQEDNEQ